MSPQTRRARDVLRDEPHLGEHSGRGVELGDFFKHERQARRRHVFLQMCNPERTGDRQDDRAPLQQPCERDLACRGAVRLRNAIDRPPGPVSSPAASGDHGMKPILLAAQ
jgi:hypothetical protein